MGERSLKFLNISDNWGPRALLFHPGENHIVWWARRIWELLPGRAWVWVVAVRISGPLVGMEQAGMAPSTSNSEQDVFSFILSSAFPILMTHVRAQQEITTFTLPALPQACCKWERLLAVAPFPFCILLIKYPNSKEIWLMSSSNGEYQVTWDNNGCKSNPILLLPCSPVTLGYDCKWQKMSKSVSARPASLSS